MNSELFDEMRGRLKDRVKPSRYMHSLGVSQTAEQLARIYGVDEDDAAIAGLLHDWDKARPVSELRDICKKYKLAGKHVRKRIPGILHSFTAPMSLKSEFPQLTQSQLQAIGRHTCGAEDMEPLDMVVFIADIIEPGRDFPDIDVLRDEVGLVSLDDLYYDTYKSTLMYLIESDMPVYPDSLKYWNTLVEKRRDSRKARSDG